MGKLVGKVAIITGAGGGLGKYIAVRFAEEGAKLALCDINTEGLKETTELCKSKGAAVFANAFDASDLDQSKEFVSATVEHYQTIDILVNLAIAIKTPHSFLDHTRETLDISYQTGLVSTWNFMKLCYPYLKEKGGKVINFGSGSGDQGQEGYAAYAAIKEAIRGLSRVAAREWGPDNINVNVINPGAITDVIQAYLDHLPEEERDPTKLGFEQTSLRRFGAPYEDIAPAVLFLASEDSRHITGQTLNVDGGVNIHA
ncbi:SDR family oxidoreductase [Bacillus sp. ISL-51]|uniref:SDR family NAD(P)-dependent oxidoreductase n=1 Tax=Bacteria TaxID=2 RepID=UPI001BE655C5|nr:MULTISPECIES: SDR family oxidoreductase [Bacteria]MBT2575200.1 SDR family oxidoreductase [Bacillus sp. ISL-51]MBT2633494.1 SDR family oxidoreductase [Bacillus sp. ISL-26]MBT2714072.1 SDR family oxidoreductase [Pseudomonas sp. ISL-88]